MKFKILNFLKIYRFHFFIYFIAFLLFFTNYVNGTYLIGWDNLQTELNPWLSVKRAFFAVWQEYQSFGLVSGLAHAADLVRSVFIWFLSLFFSQNIIRYIFHSLMLLIGGLGIFSLLNHIAFNKKRVFSLVGAIFYMLNLGTIQIFYVPYEAFSIFFAALPWEIWIFFKLLNNKSKKNLILFLLINILATPQAYIQTLFLVYLIILSAITFGKSLEEKSFLIIKKAIFPFILILIINSFWIFPQIYFLKTEGNVVKEAKINQLATKDLYYQNKEKGTFQNFIKMEGFYYDLYRSNQNPLFLEWKAHFSKFPVKTAQYLIISIILLGIFSKRKCHLSFIFIFIIVLLGLLNDDPPLSWLNDFIRQNDFIDRIFRTPFTKFIIPYSLVASYFIASGSNLLFLKLSKINSLLSKFSRNHFGIIIVLIVCYLSFPAFNGYFFSPSMKVSIPKEYFELFKALQNEDKNKRIALLPDHTFWGWFYHRWGYDGSGFLWYGIEQPIVSRTFDVWSSASESYYWEIKAAAEAEDLESFEKVLEKYNIDFLIFDRSLLPISATFKGLQYDRLENMLGISKKINLVKSWKDISLYSVARNKKVQDFITIYSSPTNIGPEIKLTNKDTAYLQNSDYINNKKREYDLYYPFLDLTTQTIISNSKWKITENTENFIISSILDLPREQYNIASISSELLDKSQELLPTIEIKNKNIKVKIQKKLISNFDIRSLKPVECGVYKGKSSSNIIGNTIIVSSSNRGSNCFGFEDSSLEQRDSFLVKIKSDNIKGQNLFLYILDLTKKQGYLETRLTDGTEYYLINPRFYSGLGYSFNFQNNSYENLSSINRLSELEVYDFPVDLLKNIKLIKKDLLTSHINFINSFESKKINYYSYKLTAKNLASNNVIVLNQSYSSGWKGYLNGKVLDNHVLVNNWANGWIIDEDTDVANIKIVFWPQYLEYVGFVVLILTFTWMIFWRKKI